MSVKKNLSIAVISDIHTDFYIKADTSDAKLDAAMDKFIENELWLKNADVLVFAGDNSHYPRQNKLMLEKIAAKKIYKKIFVTFGNHDLYIISNQQKSKYKTSWDKVLELKQICEEIDTVEFLDGNIVEVEKDFSNEFNSLKDMDYEEAKKMLQGKGNKFKTVKDMVDFLS